MDFVDAASCFDNDPVLDGYTGELLFYCHTTPHDDHTSAGATARRRTMTARNESVAPARRVVELYGDRWLVTDSNPDSVMGVLVRRNFGLKKATGLMAVLTPGEACSGSPGLPAYTHREYYRDMQDARTQSEWDVLWNVFCAPGEPVAKGSFMRQGTTLYRVRSVYPSIDGLVIAEADEFDPDAAQTATFKTGVLNLVTDRVAETAVDLPVIQADSMKFYRYRLEAEADNKPGDRVVFVAAASIAPQPGSTLAMLGANWRVLTSVIEGDARVLRVRLA